jgi:hypothetical protein
VGGQTREYCVAADSVFLLVSGNMLAVARILYWARSDDHGAKAFLRDDLTRLWRQQVLRTTI